MGFEEGSKWSRQEIIVLGIIVALSVFMVAARWNETPIGSNTDDAYYIEMARSIAEGLGPVIDTGPDAAAENPDIFPAGFPLLLSPMAKLFPRSFSALKILPIFSTLLLIPLCLILPGTQADNKTRLMVTALVMLNPWIVSWSGRVLSDVVYTVVSLSALIVFSRLKAAPWQMKKNLLVLVLLCALAISVRTVGWSLVVAISVIFFYRQQILPGLGFIMAVTLVLVPLWLFQTGEISPVSGAYWTQVSALENGTGWSLIGYNFLHYLAEIPVILVPVFGGALARFMAGHEVGHLYFPASVILGCLILWLAGFAVLKRIGKGAEGSRIMLPSLYLGVYGAVLLNFDGYPSGVQTRLLIPVLPILCWFVVLGLRVIAKRKSPHLPALIFGIMIFAALAHNGWRVVHPLRSSVDPDGRGLVDPNGGADWIADNTSPYDVIMVQEPLQRHIHFGRDVVAFPKTMTEVDLLAKLDEFGVKIVFLGPSVHFRPNRLDEKGTAMLQLVRSMPEEFQEMVSNLDEGIFVFTRL